MPPCTAGCLPPTVPASSIDQFEHNNVRCFSAMSLAFHSTEAVHSVSCTWLRCLKLRSTTGVYPKPAHPYARHFCSATRLSLGQARFLLLQLLWDRTEGNILGERRSKRAAVESRAAATIQQLSHIRRIAVGLIKVHMSVHTVEGAPARGGGDGPWPFHSWAINTTGNIRPLGRGIPSLLFDSTKYFAKACVMINTDQHVRCRTSTPRCRAALRCFSWSSGPSKRRGTPSRRRRRGGKGVELLIMEAEGACSRLPSRPGRKNWSARPSLGQVSDEETHGVETHHRAIKSTSSRNRT